MTIYSHVFINELTTHLDKKITDFYKDNFGKNKFFSKSLLTIVEELVQSEMEDVVGKEALRKLARNKQHNKITKKKRYYKKCCDMVDTNERNNDSDKYFMRNTLIQYNLTAEDKRQLLFEGMSLEDMELKKLKEIEEWATSSETLMIEYPGEDKQTPASIASNFKIDVFLNILKIIKLQYNYDLNRATYAVMNDLRNQPLFSAHRNTAVADNDLNPRELTIYKSEDGEKKLVITFPEEMVDAKGRLKLLDAKDEAILSYLINRWDEKLPTATIHGVPVLDIVQAVNPDRKRQTYESEDIVKRVSRMYEIGVKGINKSRVDEGMRIISGFRYDAATQYIYYAFDPFYMDRYNNLKIRKMSSTPLKILSNDASKILYSSFMEQRRNAYKQAKERGVIPEEYVIPLEYNYLLYWCNFGDQNKRKNYHNDIIAALDDYKDNGILIKDYTYIPNKKIYIITFYALTEDEIKDFDFYYNIKEIPVEEEEEMENLNFFLPVIDD